jgi:hypothetical protein
MKLVSENTKTWSSLQICGKQYRKTSTTSKKKKKKAIFHQSDGYSQTSAECRAVQMT